ncbi:MAG TPA: hypothetical protein VF590_08775, partial [Isosphaeraceae bacterium]
RQLALRASGLRPSSPEGLYLSYRLRLIDGDIPGALDAIARLRGSDLEKGKIPLSDNELENLSIRLPFWRSVLAIPEGGFPLVVTALAGDDARELSALALNAIESIPESLEVAEPRPIGEVRGIVIPESSNLLFAFHNPEPTGPEAGPGKTYYVYMSYIDPEGRITPASLWSSRVLWEGLPPGRGGTSNPFRQTGTFGLAEIRFFSSPELIPEFLSPPDVGARSIFAELQLDADQVEAMRMHRVYFKMER